MDLLQQPMSITVNAKNIFEMFRAVLSAVVAAIVIAIFAFGSKTLQNISMLADQVPKMEQRVEMLEDWANGTEQQKRSHNWGATPPPIWPRPRQ